MPRKPIELERAGLRTPRERMWTAMRTLVDFTPTDIEDKAHPISLSAVQNYVGGLVAAGYLEQTQANGTPGKGTRGKFLPSRYRVVKAAAITPQLDKAGQPITPSLGSLAMWRAMKVRKVFDAAQLSRDATQGATTCSLNTAKAYLKHLLQAGYVRVERKASNAGGLAVYRLLKDTGPLPPAVTKAKVVFDRNTGELSPVETAQEVCDALEA